MNRFFKGIMSVVAIVCAIIMLKNGLSEMSLTKTWDLKKSVNKNTQDEKGPAGESADGEILNGESQDEKSLDEDTKQKYISMLNEGKKDDKISYQLVQSGEYNGEKQYRFQYTIDDKPIYGRSATIVSDKKDNVIDVIDSHTNENITKTEEANITEGQADNEAEQYMMKEYSCTEDSIDRSKAEEMYYMNVKKAIPVYRYNIAGQTKSHELYGKEILVSAVDGNILSERSTICYAREKGTYNGQLKSQNIVYENTNGNCRMEDKQDEIIVFQPNDRKGSFWYRENEHYVETWQQNSSPDASAVDAMANLQKVIDFYENMVDFQSLTGSAKVNLNGSAVNTYVNVENLGIDDAAYLMSKGYKTKDFTKEESRIQDVEQVTNLWVSSMYRL